MFQARKNWNWKSGFDRISRRGNGEAAITLCCSVAYLVLWCCLQYVAARPYIPLKGLLNHLDAILSTGYVVSLSGRLKDRWNAVERNKSDALQRYNKCTLLARLAELMVALHVKAHPFSNFSYEFGLGAFKCPSNFAHSYWLPNLQFFGRETAYHVGDMVSLIMRVLFLIAAFNIPTCKS